MKFNLYNKIYEIVPSAYGDWAKTYLIYADFSIKPENFVGFSVVYSIFLAFSIGFLCLALNLSAILILGSSIGSFLLFQAFLISVLILFSERRRKATEEILPDALQLMAANIRSGLTPDRALLLSARPEFGPLEVEIRRTAKRTISGDTLEDSLTGMSKRINSKLLDRSIKLIIEGIRKGGELASLLEQTAEDIRHIRVLLKEVSAYVLMYVIFIFFAAAMAAPLLYAVSTYLVDTMSRIGELLPTEEVPVPQQIGALKISRAQIPSGFLMTYALVALTITSVFGSFIIGLIREGSEKAGLKFIPVLFALSMSIFFITKTLVAGMIAISF